jgi:energy-coupling factor transporter transmembrane protein EcfT
MTSTETKSVDADGRVFALFLLAVLVAGFLLPGSGVIVAAAALLTSVRRSKPMMIWLFAGGGFFLLTVILTIIGNGLPLVSHVVQSGT